MTAHLIADDTTRVTTPDPATTAPGWLTLSAALTEEVPVIADREDLLVTVAPGAGQGAPACFLPAHATIELDGTHLGSVDHRHPPPHQRPHSLRDCVGIAHPRMRARRAHHLAATTGCATRRAGRRTGVGGVPD